MVAWAHRPGWSHGRTLLSQGRNALARANPEVVDAVLLRDVDRCERGELSDSERIALADRLADAAREHLWRAHQLSKLAMKVRMGER